MVIQPILVNIISLALCSHTLHLANKAVRDKLLCATKKKPTTSLKHKSVFIFTLFLEDEMFWTLPHPPKKHFLAQIFLTRTLLDMIHTRV